MSAGTGILHSEKNDSWRLQGGAEHTDPVHFVQMWVVPDEPGLEPGYQQLEIDDELVRGGLVPVASGLRRHDGDHVGEGVRHLARIPATATARPRTSRSKAAVEFSSGTGCVARYQAWRRSPLSGCVWPGGSRPENSSVSTSLRSRCSVHRSATQSRSATRGNTGLPRRGRALPGALRPSCAAARTRSSPPRPLWYTALEES